MWTTHKVSTMLFFIKSGRACSSATLRQFGPLTNNILTEPKENPVAPVYV